MARMLGRYETPGDCPGSRQGRYRTRNWRRPDCSGPASNTRWRKRVEQRQFERELWHEMWPMEFAWHPDDPCLDIYDCEHGCNGDCEKPEFWGNDRCTFICHEMLRVLELI